MDAILTKWEAVLRITDVSIVNPNTVKDTTTKEIDTQRLCWHCCHPWDGMELQYPFAYDERTKKFKVGGQFCSFECVKAYARDTMSVAVSGVHMMNVRHYKKMITGLSTPICAAPPKITLKAFGGHLTIEEFRKDSDMEYIINTGKLVKLIPYEKYEYKTNEKNVTILETDTAVSIKPSDTKNEHLRLRRAKPLSHGRTNIERTLGLNSFANLIKTN